MNEEFGGDLITVTDEEGNEFYTNVEDEELAEKVFEKFLQLMDEAEEEE